MKNEIKVPGITKGLGTLDRERDKLEFFRLEDEEPKTVRFLLEKESIPILRRHYVDIPPFKGYINCLRGDSSESREICPLCLRAQLQWNAKVSIAKNCFIQVVIDRSDNRVKLFEGNEALEDLLLDFWEHEGHITGIDFQISRDRNRHYVLSFVANSAAPLSDLEKTRLNEVDLGWACQRGQIEIDEIRELLGDQTAPF